MLSDKKNKKIYFLVPYPTEFVPGQRFRFELYIPILIDNGYTVKLFPFLSRGVNEILYTKGNYTKKITGVLIGFMKRFAILPLLLRANFIFIFREVTPLGPPLIEWLLAQLFHKKIIYDFDDAIWISNTSNENKIVGWLKWHSKVGLICRWSYRVSCGNEYLASFARSFNKHVIINPTTIDTERLHNPSLYPPKKDTDSIAIGWTGTHSTLRYLEPLLPVFESLSKKYSQLRLIIIADRKPDWKLSCLDFIKWSKQTEIADLMKIDIGVMPLTDDEWARGKCGFKALQYMSLGIPALVSPVGVNATIVDHGINGMHCTTAIEWQAHIEDLIQKKEICQTMGRNGRKKVIQHYSVLSNTPTFLALFE